jgi:hypothetical protein
MDALPPERHRLAESTRLATVALEAHRLFSASHPGKQKQQDGQPGQNQ